MATKKNDESVNVEVNNNEVEVNEVMNTVDELELALQREQQEQEMQDVIRSAEEQVAQDLAERAKRPRSAWSGREQWLLNRMAKLLENPAITEKLLKEFSKMIENWKKDWVTREMQRLQAELNRLEDMKKSL